MQRRHDLDWVRVCAFGLLVLYHVGMYYVTWDWHVKSPAASDALEPFMLLSSPWRLALIKVFKQWSVFDTRINTGTGCACGQIAP